MRNVIDFFVKNRYDVSVVSYVNILGEHND